LNNIQKETKNIRYFDDFSQNFGRFFLLHLQFMNIYTATANWFAFQWSTILMLLSVAVISLKAHFGDPIDCVWDGNNPVSGKNKDENSIARIVKGIG
jgi:hypothetical protein